MPYKHILYITTAKREAIKEKKIRYPINPPENEDFTATGKQPKESADSNQKPSLCGLYKRAAAQNLSPRQAKPPRPYSDPQAELNLT